MEDSLPVLLEYAIGALMLACGVVMVYYAGQWVAGSTPAQRLPAPALKQGLTNMLFSGVAALVVFGVIGFAISLIFPQGFGDAVALVINVAAILVVAGFVAAAIRHHWKRASVSVLLDCGPHPARRLFLSVAAFFVLVGARQVVTVFAGESDKSDLGHALYLLMFSVLGLVFASGRLQIREDGIRQFWGLLTWERLQSFEWDGDWLLLQGRTRFPLPGKGALPVPHEHKDAVDVLIREHHTVVT